MECEHVVAAQSPVGPAVDDCQRQVAEHHQHKGAYAGGVDRSPVRGGGRRWPHLVHTVS